jgi:hypothetical protein
MLSGQFSRSFSRSSDGYFSRYPHALADTVLNASGCNVSVDFLSSQEDVIVIFCRASRGRLPRCLSIASR